MILDRTHRTWGVLSAAILITATVVYVRETSQSPHGVTGGSLTGLAFGTVGSACMIFAGLLAARKRVPTWRIGSAQFWLRGHIWLGLLSVPLILFHSGFGWGGWLENLLWIVFAIVIVSGVYGLIVQQLLPRWMTVRVPNETFGEQIPHRCRWLLVESDKLVAELAGKLDVSCDELRDVAFDIAYGLGKLRNGKEEEDLAKFLSAIYSTSNGEAKASPHAPAAVGVPPSGGHTPAEAGTPAPTATAAASPPADKPLSKIEQMRAATAAKKAATAQAAPVSAEIPAAKPAVKSVAAVATSATQPNPRAGEVRAFYLGEVRPFLDDRSRCLGSLGNEARARSVFSQLRASLPDELHPALSHLETCCDERRQFELQRRLHRWLHGWLIVHIPATLVLLVLFVAHVVMSLRVVPWSWPDGK